MDAIKTAASIGGKQDRSFEQTFSSLAYTHHSEKAPRLRDYLVGFQLLERDDSNNKAVGVFGFMVGEEWFYGPVFFINSQIKGHELFYIAAQDQFVPLKEKWVNFILSRRPHRLGEPGGSAIGEGAKTPDFQALIDSPSMRKFGSIPRSALDKVLPMLAQAKQASMSFFTRNNDNRVVDVVRAATEPVGFAMKAAGVTVGDELEFEKAAMADPSLGYPLLKIAQTYPTIAAAYQTLTGRSLEKLAKACLHHDRNQKVASAFDLSQTDLFASPADKLQIYFPNTPQQWAIKSANDREQLLRDGYLVIDHRDGREVTAAVELPDDFDLINPEEPGFYEVFTAAGRFERMLVLPKPIWSDKTHHNAVVMKPGDKSFAILPTSSIFCNPKQTQAKTRRNEFESWFKGLSSAGLSTSGLYMLVSDNGDCSVPFRVHSAAGEKRYEVSRVSVDEYQTEFETKPCRASHPHTGYYDRSLTMNLRGNAAGELSRLRSYDGEMFVPPNFKVIKLSGSAKPTPTEMGLAGKSVLQQVVQGNLSNLDIRVNEDAVEIEAEKTGMFRGTVKQAKLHLIDCHGLCEDQADAVVEADHAKRASYGLFYASGFPRKTEKSAYSFGDRDISTIRAGNRDIPAEFHRTDSERVEMSEGHQGSYEGMFQDPNEQVMMRAQQAAASGQREFFDLTMFSAILGSTRHDRMVDRHLASFMRTLDGTGRILMSFYWHGDEFERRYGKSELPEIEETLVNIFEQLGDLTLSLKEKSSDGSSDFGGLELTKED